MRILALLAVAALAFGCEKKEEVVKKKYHGDWILALKYGDEMVKYPCIQSPNFSRVFMAKVDAKTITMEVTLYPGNTTCDGTDKIVSATTAELEDAGSNDDQQVFEIKSSNMKVTVSGASAAAYLNDETACDRSDWKEATYDQNSDEIKSCTDSNAGTVISAPESAEETSATRIRLKEDLGGLMISTKKENEDDAEFDVSPSHYLKN